ncbi:MAG TPA: thioredoxin family protein [Solirubrobacter sp.]|nr:thioredoxin family protein [Solirubrobacter sp.]
MHPVTLDTFTAEVLEAEEPVLVDFTAAWCPPCRAMDPILASLTAVRVVSVDVDEQTQLAAQWGVLSMPTLLLFRNGAPVAKLVGARSRRKLELELQEALEQQPAGR